jgi:hypothetical protein
VARFSTSFGERESEGGEQYLWKSACGNFDEIALGILRCGLDMEASVKIISTVHQMESQISPPPLFRYMTPWIGVLVSHDSSD